VPTFSFRNRAINILDKTIKKFKTSASIRSRPLESIPSRVGTEGEGFI